MQFRIKSGWFRSYFRIEIHGQVIRVDLDDRINKATLRWTWTDGVDWSVMATNDGSPYRIESQATVIAEGTPSADESEVRWLISAGEHAGTLTLKHEWNGWRRVDRIYGDRGQMILEARHGWGMIKISLSDTWSDVVALLIAACIARRPSPAI
jgi:hypothetical protein